MTQKPKLTPADLRKVKKVATGPLLGPVPIPERPGAKKAKKAEAPAARPAALGNFWHVKARLDELLDAEKP